jgi:shikimate kinase
VERADNRTLLRGYGMVVWLEAPADALWQRIQADPATDASRPDLAGGGLEEVRRVLARRAPMYAETSHVVVRVGSRTPREVVSDIEAWLAAQK